MTIQSPPIFLQGGSHPAEDWRRKFSNDYGQRSGLFTPTDLAVTERGAGANMSVDVAGGACIIANEDAQSNQGAYFGENRGTENLVVSPSDPTNARWDIVVMQVRDSEYAGADDDVRLFVVEGTPSATPADPTVPDNCFVLARVVVGATVTSIVDANITDLRRTTSSPTLGVNQGQLATAQGGIAVCTSTTRPTDNLYDGLFIFETDTERLIKYDGSAWRIIGSDGEWISYTPTFAGTLGNGTIQGYYMQVGRIVHVKIRMVMGSTSAMPVAGSVKFTLPVNRDTTMSGECLGSVVGFDATATNYFGGAVFGSEAGQTTRIGDGNGVWDTTNPFTWTTSDTIQLSLTYWAD